MKIFRELWQLLDARQRRTLVALQFVSLAMALSTVGGIAAIVPFLTVLTQPESLQNNALLEFLYSTFGFRSPRSFTAALGIAFAALVLVANAINLLGSLAMNRFAYRAGDAFAVALFNEYLHRSYAFHAATHSSKLAGNVIYETGRVAAGIIRNGLILISNGVTLTFILIAMLMMNPLIALCVSVALGASYAVAYAVNRSRLLRNGRTESQAFSARGQVVGEGFGAVKEILLHRAQGVFVERFACASRSMSARIVNTLAISQTPKPVLETLMLFCLVGVALYLRDGRSAGSDVWLAQLSFTGLAAYRLLPALQQAFAALVRMRADRSAFENIAADLREAQRRSPTPAGPERMFVVDPLWSGRPRREIRLTGVSFRHGSERAPAIDGVTLSIPAGSLVGLAGANGSGKTTLVDVIAGLLIPAAGRMEVDGIEIDASNREAWQSTLAYVPQESVLLDATLAQNIAFGVPAEKIDKERLHHAVQLAQLESCVASLPNGYGEMLGERGMRLSGGQRQRIGIARALYREASLLILDEATNALDGQVEQEFLATLHSLRQQCTIILIAHRPGSLRYCDLIFELDAGAVAGSGTYRQLLLHPSRLSPMADLDA